MASFPEVSGQSLGWRGIVEGFYGPPWTHAQRLGLLDFSARHGLDTYVYAPKDDPFHRSRWREPYPADDLARIGELAAAADRLRIRFVAAIAPGLSMRYGEPGEQTRLHAKAASLREAGVRHFALLFDDIPGFTPDDGALGAAHGRVCAEFADHVLGPHGASRALLVCPADYAGTRAGAYRRGLAATAPAEVIITWSGPGVVSPAVTADDVVQASAGYGRPIVLWDNVPVNDFDRSRLYLGPLRERPAESALAGLLANPMIEPLASRVTLATSAAYARNPGAYEPETALAAALASEAGADASPLAPLARASGWPPDADTGAELQPAIAAALSGDPRAAVTLRERLLPLATVPDTAPATDLAREVEPWLRAGRDMARAAVSACDLLLAGDRGPAAAAGTREWLDRAERHWANVQRDTLSPFVRTILHRVAPPAEESGARYALLVAGEVPTAGEERLIALLRDLGLATRRAVRPDQPPALAIISRSATAEAAARAAAMPGPLLALFHLDHAGLARRTGVLLREERVRIVAPEHPLAAGRTDAVTVYRGPAMSRWADPAPDATVVARAEEEDRPVIVHYPAGATLADGRTAPAPRAALFLGRDLLAPWVITADGAALVAAAVADLAGAPS